MTKDLLKPRRRMIIFALWFGAATSIALLRFCYRYLDDLAHQKTGTFLPRLIEESTGIYTSALLFVGVVFFTLSFRLQRENWRRRLPVYVLGMVCFSAAHTTLMALTRQLIFPLAGLGEYDYGIMFYRYLMEFSNQVIFYWLTVTLTHLIALYRESRARELQTAQLEAELAQAQLQALQSQIQPHFLFNALNTISAVIYEDAQTADMMIVRLSNFLRGLLNSSQVQEVTLQEELNFLNLYLDIMRPRFEERLQITFAVEQGIQEALVPKLILQPLVENSIKHAADPISGAVNIEVEATRNNGSLWLQVKDNGPGLPTDEQTNLTTGVGLSNTVKRLKHLYGNQQKFVIANADLGGLLIQVSLPYHLGEPFNPPRKESSYD
ncbi:MAG: histidine kinase [Acidobacteria bacterium]|nr:histidine kinase [Acidobacteriota bacterium]